MTYLYHHGILGQRWGVRRYQNYDGTLTAAGKKRLQTALSKSSDSHLRKIHDDDIVIERGSVRSHVSDKKKLSLTDQETYIYDQDNAHDKEVYEGAYAEYIRLGKRFANQYVYKYAVTDNLISPSEKRRVDIFLEAYKEHPVEFANEMNRRKANLQRIVDYAKEDGYTPSELGMHPRDESIAKYDKMFGKDTPDDILRNIGYDAYNGAAEAGSKNSKAVPLYYSKLMNMGYNALVDDNNRSIYNDAAEPFIALNGSKTLKELYSYRLDPKDRERNLQAVSDYNYRKTGNGRVIL